MVRLSAITFDLVNFLKYIFCCLNSSESSLYFAYTCSISILPSFEVMVEILTPAKSKTKIETKSPKPRENENFYLIKNDIEAISSIYNYNTLI